MSASDDRRPDDDWKKRAAAYFRAEKKQFREEIEEAKAAKVMRAAEGEDSDSDEPA